MSEPSWKYETSIGNEICISIRSKSTVPKKRFDEYFTDFVRKYSQRINLIDICFDKLCDGSNVIFILLNGRDFIDFDGKV